MASEVKACLSFDFINKIIHYDPDTGQMFWKVNRPPKGKAGSQAGSQDKIGRIFIGIKQKHICASHIAWLLMTGEWATQIIDHEDKNPGNNKWSNLRLATHTENMRNGSRKSHSKQPYKGVKKHHSRWVARITVNYKSVHIGVFDTPEMAYEAYKEAAVKYHGQFASFT